MTPGLLSEHLLNNITILNDVYKEACKSSVMVRILTEPRVGNKFASDYHETLHVFVNIDDYLGTTLNAGVTGIVNELRENTICELNRVMFNTLMDEVPIDVELELTCRDTYTDLIAKLKQHQPSAILVTQLAWMKLVSSLYLEPIYLQAANHVDVCEGHQGYLQLSSKNVPIYSERIHSAKSRFLGRTAEDDRHLVCALYNTESVVKLNGASFSFFKNAGSTLLHCEIAIEWGMELGNSGVRLWEM